MIPELLSKYPIISDQIKRPALEVVLGNLEKTLQAGTAGDIVEFGCYIGTTSLFVQRILDKDAQAGGAGRAFHVYDSFAGLPPKVRQDITPVGDAFQAGELTVSKKQFIAEFQKARLHTPIIHKGWFSDLTPEDVPEHIAFAFLDGDFYESIIDSLRLTWPRMAKGGIICIDDYKRDALPGVERAVQDLFQDKPVHISVAHNIGVIQVR